MRMFWSDSGKNTGRDYDSEGICFPQLGVEVRRDALVQGASSLWSVLTYREPFTPCPFWFGNRLPGCSNEPSRWVMPNLPASISSKAANSLRMLQPMSQRHEHRSRGVFLPLFLSRGHLDIRFELTWRTVHHPSSILKMWTATCSFIGLDVSSCVLFAFPMEKSRRKFASQADGELLDIVRDLAREEGWQFQVVLEEALSDWVERKRGGKPRSDVMAHLAGSVAAHRELYCRLAQ
jgi:hypothetical protein